MAYMIQVAFSKSYKIVNLKLLKFSCANFNLLVRVLLVGPSGHMKPSSAVGLGLSVGSNILSSSAYIVIIYHSLYDMPGLAPHTDVSFCKPSGFSIRFSNRDTSMNAWNRHGMKSMVDTRMLSNNMKLPFHFE